MKTAAHSRPFPPAGSLPIRPDRVPLRVLRGCSAAASRSRIRGRALFAGLVLGCAAAGLLWFGAAYIPNDRLVGAMAAAASIAALALAVVVPGPTAIVAVLAGTAAFALALGSLAAAPWCATAALGLCALSGLLQLRAGNDAIAWFWSAWNVPVLVAALARSLS